ncbi:MAG: type I restriction endonuclease subunit R, partial [Methanosarcinaceae archaeon]|nr:type I restriction endonuclease subunit R [Methanosarcinaceae archaeon]
NITLGRQTSNEVILVPRLRVALERLNPDLPKEAIDLAIEELARDRSIMSPANANRDVYLLLKNGVKVSYQDSKNDNGQIIEKVQVIDWNVPSNNDYFLASQLWVSGEMHKRRPDLMGFVNGLPLIFIELKASYRRLENAYQDNLRDYKTTIPQIFWYNALIILSNGSQSKIGSITSAWEHLAEWKKINSEGEEGIISLETMILGTCEPSRLLDIVENFTIFSEASGGLAKLVAKNHQYLGVNNAIRSLLEIKENQGKLGVFWHTQGSGKSYSMAFFSQKVLRKLPGNYTFVIITDRRELDNQIYKNFANTGIITEEHSQATNGEHLKQLLSEDHRFIFTLIQKFRTKKDETTYPMISDRDDIIVITDEAHRSQYDTLATNMRNALPNAAFIAFTGTPLIVGEEKTREVFGDYISIYDFKQSVDDGATVPLYYENRIPELQLTNENMNEDMQSLIEDAELDEEQEKKFAREFSREYHLITREKRLEKVAEDIVAHFMGRGTTNKAMVISIDKATAVKMYDKVQVYWQKYLKDLESKPSSSDEMEKQEHLAKIKFMKETDMAVVVSQEQNEITTFKEKGLDIAPHRRRIVNEDLDKKFKDAKDPFRIVFICAMWMTGFDVPSCSTIYLDKPMRNHTLMQTISRANRVYGDKLNGLIVDYIGVFRNLEKALAIYGSPTDGTKNGETPVKDKSFLVDALKQAIDETIVFCKEHNVSLSGIEDADGFGRVKLIDDAVDSILISDDSKKKYLLLAGSVARIYKAILPDKAANGLAPCQKLITTIAEKIRSLTPKADISGIMEDVEILLDKSIATEGYVFHDPSEQKKYGEDNYIDLSQIDFEALKSAFENGRKRIETEKLRASIERKLIQLVRLNKTRIDYLEKFKIMIDEYNSGSHNVEMFFTKLMAFTKELNAEEKRAIAENLTEEELTIFDLLKTPDISLTKKDELQVKKVAQKLLETLKGEKLVLDWRKRQQSRASVRVSIEVTLDLLPRIYTPEIYQKKCDLVYQHVYDSYFGSAQSIYAHV